MNIYINDLNYMPPPLIELEKDDHSLYFILNCDYNLSKILSLDAIYVNNLIVDVYFISPNNKKQTLYLNSNIDLKFKLNNPEKNNYITQLYFINIIFQITRSDLYAISFFSNITKTIFLRCDIIFNINYNNADIYTFVNGSGNGYDIISYSDRINLVESVFKFSIITTEILYGLDVRIKEITADDGLGPMYGGPYTYHRYIYVLSVYNLDQFRFNFNFNFNNSFFYFNYTITSNKKYKYICSRLGINYKKQYDARKEQHAINTTPYKLFYDWTYDYKKIGRVSSYTNSILTNKGLLNRSETEVYRISVMLMNTNKLSFYKKTNLFPVEIYDIVTKETISNFYTDYRYNPLDMPFIDFLNFEINSLIKIYRFLLLDKDKKITFFDSIYGIYRIKEFFDIGNIPLENLANYFIFFTEEYKFLTIHSDKFSELIKFVIKVNSYENISNEIVSKIKNYELKTPIYLNEKFFDNLFNIDIKLL